MQKLNFSCKINNDSDFEDLGLEFWLDNDKFFDALIPNGQTTIIHELIEDESNHSLKIVLKNKTTEHTTVDESGQIISDALISIDDILFDEVDIDQLFYEHCIYTHNYNGSGPDTKEKFYGNLGCNGTVEFKFSTPFYMWLLENM